MFFLNREWGFVCVYKVVWRFFKVWRFSRYESELFVDCAEGINFVLVSSVLKTSFVNMNSPPWYMHCSFRRSVCWMTFKILYEMNWWRLFLNFDLESSIFCLWSFDLCKIILNTLESNGWNLKLFCEHSLSVYEN